MKIISITIVSMAVSLLASASIMWILNLTGIEQWRQGFILGVSSMIIYFNIFDYLKKEKY